MRAFVTVVTLSLLTLACDSANFADPVEPVAPGSKADVGTRVTDRGVLPFGADQAVTGTFAEDLQFDGFTLAVRAGAVVTVEVTHLGTSAALDTMLYVYGPRNEQDGYGSAAIARDDDTGWGRLSRLTRLPFQAAGTYLVVIGTRDGTGRGHYRLQATCESGDCAPLLTGTPHCHADIVAAVQACVDNGLGDPDYDSDRVSMIDLIEQCADPEVTSGARDALCQGAGAPAELCAMSVEEFSAVYLPVCARELVGLALDQTCVFGEYYRDMFWRPGPVVVVSERVLTVDSLMTDLERQQILLAVRTTAYEDVTTLEEAFDAVDENEVNQTEVWDASNRLAFTVYEVGAGDNSFGMYFRYQTLEPAARNNDGDIYDCTVTWGLERRPCESNADCAQNLACTGRSSDFNRGVCIAVGLDTQAAISTECTTASPCPDPGLVCAGASVAGNGICLPAWMRGRFVSEPELAIPDASPEGVIAHLPVYGLASVAMDVVLDLYIDHPRIRDLTVTLEDPATTRVVIFDGDRDGAEIYLRDFVVLGFPGDESVNGFWKLHVTDRVTGQTGTIEDFSLTITSRWD